MSRFHGCLLVLIIVTASSGCQWLRSFVPVHTAQAPRLLPEKPTLEQVVGVVNGNSDRIHAYSASGARVSSPGVPPLRANIAIQRPRRFRLVADLPLSGPEVDLGSNDELFWFWVRRSQPPALYFCRHDQFNSSAATQVIPVEPRWLIDALGLMRFDPAVSHSGPHPVRGDRLEIRSITPGLAGGQVKVTLVDAAHGWVTEQHVYTSDGRRLASAIASLHRYDPVHNVSLPGHVEVQVPSAQMLLKIDVGEVVINQLTGDPAQLWTRPVIPGYTEVDLSSPGNRALPAARGLAIPQNSQQRFAPSPTPPPGSFPGQQLR